MSADAAQRLFAVRSESQAKVCRSHGGTGYAEWSTPSGGTVIVTTVSTTHGCPECRWPDKQDMGEVVQFVRALS